ncbi:MAG: Rdx family protein [Dehalococcoidia bacterium]
MRAAWTAAELLTELGNRVEALRLVPSGGGRFEVTVNGKLAYSKAATGRFPELSEVQQAVREMLT